MRTRRRERASLGGAPSKGYGHWQEGREEGRKDGEKVARAFQIGRSCGVAEDRHFCGLYSSARRGIGRERERVRE